MSDDLDADLATGFQAWDGSVPSRPIDIERTLRLRLAVIDRDQDAYLTTLGAILRDNSGPTRVTAIVATINNLVADLEILTINLVGEQATTDILKTALLESLRSAE